jgi:nucleotide-binding universal stress UspA family protein
MPFEPDMTPPILIAVDPRRHDPAPLALGLRLARVAAAPIVLASTADECLGVAAQGLLDTRASIPAIQLRRLPDGSSPAHGLQALARELEPLAMVLGSSSRGQLGRVFPGAVTDRVMHGAPCAIAVAPRGRSLESADTPLRRIGVAWVDTPDGRAALTAAAALAQASAAYLRLLVVMRPRDQYVSAAPALPAFDDEAARRQDAEAELRRGLEGAGDASASGQVLDGEPATALAAVSPDLDLLVCGSRDQGPVRTAMLGGTSHALVRRAACPMLVVPCGTEAALAAAWRQAAAGMVA